MPKATKRRRVAEDEENEPGGSGTARPAAKKKKATPAAARDLEADFEAEFGDADAYNAALQRKEQDVESKILAISTQKRVDALVKHFKTFLACTLGKSRPKDERIAEVETMLHHSKPLPKMETIILFLTTYAKHSKSQVKNKLGVKTMTNRTLRLRSVDLVRYVSFWNRTVAKLLLTEHTRFQLKSQFRKKYSEEDCEKLEIVRYSLHSLNVQNAECCS
jgi:hypothetical protein